MYTTVDTYSVREKFGDIKGLEIIKNAGFDGVDFSFYWLSEKRYFLGDGYVDYAKKIKSKLSELNLICYQSHAPFDLKYGEDFSLENRHYRDIVRSIESASIIGAKMIVVHSLSVPDGVDETEYNVKYYNSLLSVAKKFGIKIAVENLQSSLNSIEKCRKILSLLDGNYFCFCLDVGHAFIKGFNPEDYVYEFGKDFLECVHIQDTDGESDRHWIPYFGKLDWDKIIASLAENNFKGTINFEVFRCFANLPEELFLPQLKYVQSVGRFLIKGFEARQEK